MLFTQGESIMNTTVEAMLTEILPKASVQELVERYIVALPNYVPLNLLLKMCKTGLVKPLLM